MYELPLMRQSVGPLTIKVVITAAAWLGPCRSSTAAKARTSSCSAALAAGRCGSSKQLPALVLFPLEPAQSLTVSSWAGESVGAAQ